MRPTDDIRAEQGRQRLPNELILAVGPSSTRPDPQKAYMMVAEVDTVLEGISFNQRSGPPLALRAASMLVLCVMGLQACSAFSGSESSSPVPEDPPEYQGLRAKALGPHRAVFRLEFEAEESWLYRVETRVSSEATEHNLRVEGVSDARDPGDVRIVTRGDETRMKGPATHDSCLRFPRGMDLNVRLLSPDDVIPVEELDEPLVSLGQDVVAGRPAVHYAVMQDKAANWERVLLGIWLDRTTQAALRYDLSARGRDPYFTAGFGEIVGSYEVVEVGPQTIEPLGSCEIELPLPPEARQLVRLPDEISYQVEMTADGIIAFYRRTMADEGWQPLDEEARDSGAVALRYRREAQRVVITVRDMGDHRRVDINIR